MTFKDGLLKARGQITFVAALAISTGIIIYLENLDTEARIQSRIASELARRGGTNATTSPALEISVRQTLQQAQDAYAADPAASANRAAILVSLSTAVRLGVLTQDEGLTRVRKVVDELAQRPRDRNVELSSALQAVAATFPSLQERVVTLQSGT